MLDAGTAGVEVCTSVLSLLCPGGGKGTREAPALEVAACEVCVCVPLLQDDDTGPTKEAVVVIQ